MPHCGLRQARSTRSFLLAAIRIVRNVSRYFVVLRRPSTCTYHRLLFLSMISASLSPLPDRILPRPNQNPFLTSTDSAFKPVLLSSSARTALFTSTTSSCRARVLAV